MADLILCDVFFFIVQNNLQDLVRLLFSLSGISFPFLEKSTKIKFQLNSLTFRATLSAFIGYFQYQA